MTRRTFAQRIVGAILAHCFGFIFDLAERVAPAIRETNWVTFNIPMGDAPACCTSDFYEIR